MWPTRAPGTTLSMPSRMPVPARRIETNTSFFPSMTLAVIFSIGVSISMSCTAMSRVTSYAISDASSPSSRRKLLVLASFLRISVSLCCTRGWSMRWTWDMAVGQSKERADYSEKAGADSRTRRARNRREGRERNPFKNLFRVLRETFASFAYGCPPSTLLHPREPRPGLAGEAGGLVGVARAGVLGVTGEAAGGHRADEVAVVDGQVLGHRRIGRRAAAQHPVLQHRQRVHLAGAAHVVAAAGGHVEAQHAVGGVPPHVLGHAADVLGRHRQRRRV